LELHNPAEPSCKVSFWVDQFHTLFQIWFPQENSFLGTPCVANQLLKGPVQNVSITVLKGSPSFAMLTILWVILMCLSFGSCNQLYIDPQHTSRSPYNLSSTRPALMWTTRIGTVAVSSPVAAADGSIYIGYAGYNNGGLSSLNGTTGDIRWTFEIGDNVVSSPALAEDWSAVFFGGLDRKVYALSTVTGTLKWTYSAWHGIAAAMVVVNDRLFATALDGYLHAINATSGFVIWRKYMIQGNPLCPVVLGFQMWSVPAFSPDGRTLFVGSFDGRVYSVNTTTGQTIWTFSTNGWVFSSPAMLADGRVAIGSTAELYLLWPNGTMMWSRPLPGSVQSSPLLYLNDSMAIVSTAGHSVLAVNTSNSSSLYWRFHSPLLPLSPVPNITAAVRCSEMLDVGAAGMDSIASFVNFYHHGSLGFPFQSNPVVSNDGVLLVALFDRRLYGIDIRSGIQLWNVTLGARILA
jgi:outer membrane protein assembly factor BamB